MFPSPPPLPSSTQPLPRFPQATPTLLSVSMGHAYMFFDPSPSFIQPPPSPLPSDSC